jgi:hypothetical protein
MWAGLAAHARRQVLVGDSDLGAQGRAGGHREGLRRTDGEAAGIQLGTSLVDRQAGNVGSVRRRPLGWAGSPSAGGVRAWRSLRSSPSPREVGTWRREAASRPGCGWNGRRFLVNTGTPWTAGTANPAHIGTRRASGGGLRRARCVATRTAGSEVRAGETGRWQRRHRAPARPYDRRATLFYPPAVLLTTLIFATVLAVAKSWGRIRGGRTPGVQRR